TKLRAGAPLNEPDHGVFEGHPFLKPLAVLAHCLYGLGPHLSDEFREENDSSKIEDGPGISSWNDRALAALLEQNQQEDGSIVLPQALAPYLGYRRITT